MKSLLDPSLGPIGRSGPSPWMWGMMISAYAAAWQADLVSTTWLLVIGASWGVAGWAHGRVSENWKKAIPIGLGIILAIVPATQGMVEAFIGFVGILQAGLVVVEVFPAFKVLMLSLTLFSAATAGLADIVWIGFFIIFVVCVVGVLTGTGRSSSASLEWRPVWRTAAIVLAVSLVVFFILPRPGPLAGGMRLTPAQGSNGLSAFSGFSDTMRMGRYGEIKLDTRILLRVEIPSWTGPHPDGLRLKGHAFDYFDGRQWHRGPLSQRSEEWQRRHARMTGVKLEQEVYAEPSPLEVLVGLPTPISFQPRVPVMVDEYGASVFVRPLNALTRYKVVSYIAQESMNPDPGDPEWAPSYTSLTPAESFNERLRGLARQITGSFTSREDRMKAIVKFLNDQYRYTVRVEASSLEQFLWTTREGHCEYFATACCLLARSVGIPARVTNGFLTNEYNAMGNFYLVRGSHAHAWTEMLLPRKGWVVVDATPPSAALEAAVAQGQRWTITLWWQNLEMAWLKYFVDFDASDQWSIASWAAQHWLMGVIGGLTLGLGGILVRWWRRRRPPGSFYEEMMDRLARLGWRRLPHLTPLEFANYLADPRVGPPVRDLTDLYYQVRFGGHQLTDQENHRVNQRLKELGRLKRV